MMKLVCTPLYPDFYSRLIQGLWLYSWSPSRRTDTYHFSIPISVQHPSGELPLYYHHGSQLAPPTTLVFPQIMRPLSLRIISIATHSLQLPTIHSYSSYCSDVGVSSSTAVFDETHHISVTLVWVPLDLYNVLSEIARASCCFKITYSY